MKSKHRRGVRPWHVVAGLTVALIAAAGIGMATAQAGPDAPGIPADKAALIKAENDKLHNTPKRQKPTDAQGRAQAAQAAIAGRSGPVALGANADEKPVAGIVDTHQGPFPGAEFEVRNMYRAQVGNRWMYVFAGGDKDEAGSVVDGALRVFAEPTGGEYAQVGVFRAPTGTQSVRVVSVKGTILTVSTDGGRTATFNLATLTFN